jgi:hypothetical protein
MLRWFRDGVPSCFRIVNSSSTTASTWRDRIFSYKELHTATNGFSEENKLGEGGFGSACWGKTSDELQVIPKIYNRGNASSS